MKLIVVKLFCMTGLLCVSLSSCQDMLPDSLQSKMNSTKDVISEKVSDTVTDLLEQQLHDFIYSDDLKSSLGLTDDGQSALDESINSYLENYDWNTEDYDEVKDELLHMIEDFSNEKDFSISKEELNQKLDEILKQ